MDAILYALMTLMMQWMRRRAQGRRMTRSVICFMTGLMIVSGLAQTSCSPEDDPDGETRAASEPPEADEIDDSAARARIDLPLPKHPV